MRFNDRTSHGGHGEDAHKRPSENFIGLVRFAESDAADRSTNLTLYTQTMMKHGTLQNYQKICKHKQHDPDRSLELNPPYLGLATQGAILVPEVNS